MQLFTIIWRSYSETNISLFLPLFCPSRGKNETYPKHDNKFDIVYPSAEYWNVSMACQILPNWLFMRPKGGNFVSWFFSSEIVLPFPLSWPKLVGKTYTSEYSIWEDSEFSEWWINFSWTNLIGTRIISYLIFLNAVRNILFVVSFRIIRLNQTKFIIYTYNVFEICNFFERSFQDFDYFYRGYIFYIPIFDRTIFSDDTTDLSRNADNDGFQVSDRREWPINRWLLCAINYLIERFSTYHADKNERRECNTFEIWC